VYLEALPPPLKLSVVGRDKSSHSDHSNHLLAIQEALNKAQQDNMEKHSLKHPLVGVP